jgi:methionyl-tRNA synthetase
MSTEESERNSDPALLYAANQSREEPMLYCPVCSERLAESRCKLICEKCGYFMSCADYY